MTPPVQRKVSELLVDLEDALVARDSLVTEHIRATGALSTIKANLDAADNKVESLRSLVRDGLDAIVGTRDNRVRYSK